MNTGLTARVVLAALTCLMALPAVAGEAEIRKNLGQRIPQLAQIEEVRKTPMPGLWEVRVNGADLLYTDDQGNFLLQGQLIDVKAKRNLTEERVAKLSQVDFARLPLKDSIKFVRGNGKRQLAVFEDPNCGYCKKFEKELAQVDNVTVHLFLYPVLGPDSHVKSRDIACNKNPAKTWSDWMDNATKPPTAQCDAPELARNIEFGRKHNITGTPTLIFADGSRVPGAISLAELEKHLGAAR